MSKQDSSPTRDVAELMRAIYATYPSVNMDVAVHLRHFGDADHADVTVMGLPDSMANLAEDWDSGYLWTTETPSRYGIHLNVTRRDGDISGALTAALEFITERSAVVL